MSRTKTAPTLHRSAALSSEFGLIYATKLFGAEAIASLPILKTGPNKGKPKGDVNWLRTTAPGYHPNMSGGVGAGVTVRAWIGQGMCDQSAAMTGMWLGRVQTLCGSACYLGEEARAQEMARQAREAAHYAADLADELSGATP